MNDKTATPRKDEEAREAALMPPVDVVEDSAGITLYAPAIIISTSMMCSRDKLASATGKV